jgi:hypothetical protein
VTVAALLRNLSWLVSIGPSFVERLDAPKDYVASASSGYHIREDLWYGRGLETICMVFMQGTADGNRSTQNTISWCYIDIKHARSYLCLPGELRNDGRLISATAAQW